MDVVAGKNNKMMAIYSVPKASSLEIFIKETEGPLLFLEKIVSPACALIDVHNHRRNVVILLMYFLRPKISVMILASIRRLWNEEIA